MLSQHAIIRRLTLASMMVGLTGCISTGTKVTEQKDPFLPANPAVVSENKVATEPAQTASPVQPREDGQAKETNAKPPMKLVAFEEVPHSANAEEVVISPMPTPTSPSEMDISGFVFKKKSVDLGFLASRWGQVQAGSGAVPQRSFLRLQGVAMLI